ncbi:MAG: YitT family protein [Bacilli bacterium]
MGMFDYFRKKKIDTIVDTVKKKNICKRYLMLILGCLIVAFSFNLFFLRYDIVCFGVSGISIVLNEFGVNPSLFILISNIVLMIIAFFVLGYENMKNQLVGALSYPIFVSLTEMITRYIDLGNTEMVVIAILGGVFAGIGYGLIYKSNFSTGGTDVIIGIICKYFKISMGNASLIVNGIIVLIGKIVFSWDIVLYAILVSYLISVFTDKVLLGISKCKAFYIVTDKKNDELVRKFLLSIDGVGTTVIDAEGGYSNNEETLLLAVVPSRSYFIVKDGLKEIDKNMFFLVCDSYEVSEKGDFS